MKRQCQQLINALRVKPMTSLEILQSLGIYRASARIYDLRAEGERIATELVVVPNRDGAPCRVARYALLPREDFNHDLWDCEQRKAA